MLKPDEIRAELDARNMSIRDLAGAIGLDENKLSKSLLGTRRFQADELAAIEREFAPADPDAEPLRKIPWLGKVPAGRPAPAEQHRGKWVAVSDPDTPPNAYALTPDGDSMDLVVPKGVGITMIIDPDDKALWPGKRYIVRTEDGRTTFKEFQDEPARLVPCSSNDEHKDIMLGGEPVTILGRVWSYTLRDIPRRAS